MDAFLLQLLNGLDKGGAYALIALGLTLIFGTLGVVNFGESGSIQALYHKHHIDVDSIVEAIARLLVRRT